MASDIEKSTPPPVPPSAPSGADEETQAFLRLLQDLEALRDTGTIIEHLSPDAYRKKVRP